MQFKDLLLAFTLILSVLDFAQGSPPPDNPAAKTKPELQLSTTIVDERYVDTRGIRSLRWTLKLTFTNGGVEPVLIDRKSSLIYRVMVSKNLKASEAQKYEYDASHSYPNPAQGVMRASEPKESDFVLLRPGDSHTVTEESGIHINTGKKMTEDFLKPGSYVLQVRIATWFYFAEPELWRQRWREKGYLWSQNLTSEPMMFTVSANPTLSESSHSKHEPIRS